MRCELIHGMDYVDAGAAWADAHFDAAMDPDIQADIVDNCRAIAWEREAFHGARSADDFCFTFDCLGWGKANRWSERVQRDQTPVHYVYWLGTDPL